MCPPRWPGICALARTLSRTLSAPQRSRKGPARRCAGKRGTEGAVHEALSCERLALDDRLEPFNRVVGLVEAVGSACGESNSVSGMRRVEMRKAIAAVSCRGHAAAHDRCHAAGVCRAASEAG